MESYIEKAITFLKSNCLPENEIIDMRWVISNKTDISGNPNRVQEVKRPMMRGDIEGIPGEEAGGLQQAIDRNIDLPVNENAVIQKNVDRMSAIPGHYSVIGTLGEGDFALGANDGIWDFPRDPAENEIRADLVKFGNWRNSLVEDPVENGALRIMLEPFAGQLLYSYRINTPKSPGEWPSWRDGTEGDRVTGDIAYHYKPADEPAEANPMSLGVAMQASDAEDEAYVDGFVDAPDDFDRGVNLAVMKNPVPYSKPLIYQFSQQFLEFRNLAGGNGGDTTTYPLIPRNSYIGDITETTEYGILMPAINARLFSDDYIALQNKWYFKYINYLHNEIENIVRGRIAHAIESGQLLKDIAAEPVDLFYLTGRQYWYDASFSRGSVQSRPDLLSHVAGDVVDATAAYTNIGNSQINSGIHGVGSPEAKRLFEQQFIYEGLQRNQEDTRGVAKASPIYKKFAVERDVQEITIDVEKYEITKASLLATIADANVELERIRDKNIDLYGFGSNNSNYQWLIMTESGLNYVDNSDSSTVTQISYQENQRASALRGSVGLEGVLEFWNSRLSKVLVELYNKDIIDLPATDIVIDYYDEGDARKTDSINLIGIQNETPRLRAANTNARTFSNLTSYNININEYMSDGSQQIWATETTSLQAANEQFIELNANHQIIRSLGISYNGGNHTLNKDNIDKIGYMGFSDLEIINEVWPGGPYINYIFLNFMPADYQEQYASGSWMRDIILAGEFDQDGTWYAMNQARNRFRDYIIKQRQLIARYLEKISDTIIDIRLYSTLRENVKNIKQEAQQQIEDIERTIGLAESNPKLLSPFSPPSLADRPVTLNKGAGRLIHLHSIVAQQWQKRFAHWEVRGVNDIKNYGPKAGGVPFTDPGERYWGWDTRVDLSQDDQEEEEERIKSKGIRANLGAWDEPKPLFYLDKLKSNRPEDLTYSYLPFPLSYEDFAKNNGEPWLYDVLGEHRYLDDYNQTWMYNQPPALMWDRKDTRENWLEIYEVIKVVHLVNAGFVDLELFKTQLFHRFGWKDIGFETGLEHKLIIGGWPETIYVSQEYWANNATLENPINLNSGELYNIAMKAPYYLIDQDLDFVEPAYRQAFSGPGAFKGRGTLEEAYLIGLEPEDWIKSNQPAARFRPTTDRRHILYPTSEGRRLGLDEHLPDLPIEAVRQLVNVNGRKPWLGIDPRRNISALPKAYEITNVLDIFDPRGRGIGYGLNDAWQGFSTSLILASTSELKWQFDDVDLIYKTNWSGNPEWSGVPTFTWKDVPGPVATNIGIRGQYQMMNANPNIGSVMGVFESDGYTQYDANNPFGIPSADVSGTDKVPTLNIGAYFKPRSERAIGDNNIPVRTAHSRTMSDMLMQLPDDFEYGFFDSVVNANRNFAGGNSLDSSLAKFMVEHLIKLLPFGRRMMVENYNETGHKPRGDSLDSLPQNANAPSMSDVTYGDVFNSLLGGRNESTADFTTQTIKNIAEIPIKREVVDSLINRKNTNMSLLQLIKQLMDPSAIGLPGNVQLGVRNINGIIEIFPASISYKNIVTDMFQEAAKAEQKPVDQGGVAPINQMLFDYKIKNSLIENIDMSSKMDPAAFLTYQNSSDILRGRDYNVLKMLSYEGIAEDFKEFLDGTADVSNDGETYSGIITTDASRKITIQKSKFMELPGTIIDSFISQDPERWAKIVATMQGQNNFTTELLAFYMRGVTLTIHGTTNLQPFNLIHVTGVMPDLEGIYIITNLTEKITPTTFQTIIEGKLLKRKRISDDKFI